METLILLFIGLVLHIIDILRPEDAKLAQREHFTLVIKA